MTQAAPLSIYEGFTWHKRLVPKPHAFRYRLFSICLDVDRVVEAARSLRLLREGRAGIVSFANRDHGDRSGAPLRPWVEDRLGDHDLPKPASIELLTFPRIFGYVFNPISVFICKNESGRAFAAIYEVNNTFGDTHSYVAPLSDTAQNAHRHHAEKNLYVSPFFERSGVYKFQLLPPAQTFYLGITYRDKDDKDVFRAGWQAKRRPVSDGQLARLLLTQPWVTLKAISAIHWEALWIWRKGGVYHSRPEALHTASTRAQVSRQQ